MVYIHTTPVTHMLGVSTEAPWSQNPNLLYLGDAWRKLPNTPSHFFIGYSAFDRAIDIPSSDVPTIT